MDTWVLSTLGLLWIMLLWTFVYEFLNGYQFSFLLDTYLGVEFLEYVITLCLTISGIASLYSRVTAISYITTSMGKVLISPTFFIVHLFICIIYPSHYGYPGGYEVVSRGYFFSFFSFCNMIYFLYTRFLLVISFIHISVYMSIPITQFITPTPPAASPPWCPYVCSLHVCLNFCLANRFICTIFLGSTYMR